MAAFSAKEVAKWFLARNNANVEQHDEELLTHLKLQKLLYYAQGVYLAYTEGELLFKEEILAWEHGPVVREVWDQYRAHGRDGINYTPDQEALVILRKVEKNEDAQNVLEMVYDHYGKYSAWKLREMTHEERPWKTTKQNEAISTHIIKKYFEEEVLVD